MCFSAPLRPPFPPRPAVNSLPEAASLLWRASLDAVSSSCFLPRPSVDNLRESGGETGEEEDDGVDALGAGACRAPLSLGSSAPRPIPVLSLFREPHSLCSATFLFTTNVCVRGDAAVCLVHLPFGGCFGKCACWHLEGDPNGIQPRKGRCVWGSAVWK